METQEVEFIAENTLIQIVPKFNHAVIHLITGEGQPRSSITIRESKLVIPFDFPWALRFMHTAFSFSNFLIQFEIVSTRSHSDVRR